MSSNTIERLANDSRVKVLSGWKKLLPIYLQHTRGGWQIKVFPLQFICWFFALGIGGYLFLASLLYLNDRYRIGLDGISWVGRIYPPKWGDYKVARGESYLRQAKENIEKGEYAKAFHQLRAGLARAPQDKDGRLMLAQFLSYSSRNDLAIDVLIEGLQYHIQDQGYVQNVIAYLSSKQKDTEIIGVFEQWANHPKVSEATRRYLTVAMANALYHQGNFDQAEDAMVSSHLHSSPDARLLTAQIEWGRGFPELAMALIEQLHTEFPDNLSVYRVYVQWLRESGQIDHARRISLMRRIRIPQQPDARFDLAQAYEQAGDSKALANEIDGIFRDFADDQQIMIRLGDFAANSGNPELVERIMVVGKDVPIPQGALHLMLVEALVVRGDNQKALNITRTILEDNPEWEESLAPVFHGLQAIAYFSLGDREEANLFLDSYLGLKNIRADNLVAVANRLDSVGAHREARRVLVHAISTDPLNQAALTRLVELDLEAPDAPELPKNLEHLLTMRRTSPSLLRAAYDKLGSDRYLFVENRNQIMDILLNNLMGTRLENAPTSG